MKPMKTAVIYLRTSSDRQKENTSLDHQSIMCKKYCEMEGLEIVDTLRKEATSAKDTNEKRVAELLDYCKKNKNKFEVLVVFKLDRFARSQEHHHFLRGQLLNLGVHLRSATEKIDDTSSGQLLEGILASISEFDNRVRSERAKAGMMRRADEGYWVWGAMPTGYKKITQDGMRRKKAVQDELCAGKIKKIFNYYSTGKFTFQSLADYLKGDPFVTHKGNQIKMCSQFIQKVLINHAYLGLQKNSQGELIKAQHPPITTEAIYQKCQDVMAGKSNNATSTRLSQNPDFPLRNFTTCSTCKKPLTACWSKGRNKKYGYYYCFNRTCSMYSAMIKKGDLEEDFYEHLKTIKPHDGVIEIFKRIVIAKYRSRANELDQDYSHIRQQLNLLEEKRGFIIKKA
ncbi:MAG: recombinase family protein, partial [Candidatus Omnitrophica bacterium]|nr:recombinase family protein [Candidatus Omnitrophota bacterium]